MDRESKSKKRKEKRKTDRQTSKQASKQADRRTDKQTDRQTDRDRKNCLKEERNKMERRSYAVCGSYAEKEKERRMGEWVSEWVSKWVSEREEEGSFLELRWPPLVRLANDWPGPDELTVQPLMYYLSNDRNATRMPSHEITQDTPPGMTYLTTTYLSLSLILFLTG